MSDSADVLAEFLRAATVPTDGTSHPSGTLDRAEKALHEHPELPGQSIYAAAVLGDDASVQRFIAGDPSSVKTKGGPHGWDPLLYVCFSRYLRLDPSKSEGFVRTVTLLLDAGADPNATWLDHTHEPPESESALYGAAGVAQNEALTRLLLARGADPNDGETPYHVPETYDLGTLKAIVESGRANADSLATMLLRKCDWHDLDGVVYLLEHGADPNHMAYWSRSALHHAVRRDNRLAIIEALLDHGADLLLRSLPPRNPNGPPANVTPLDIAILRGRGDILRVLDGRGVDIRVTGIDELIEACARGDRDRATTIAAAQPELVRELVSDGGTLLAEFAGNANVEGVRLLLDLGVPVGALYESGDGYFGIAPKSTALHVAAWRAQHDVLKLLIARGADVNARDALGRTPLQLAVLACVDAWWSGRRSPASVQALLDARASTEGVRFPSGYAEVDELLRQHGAATST